MSDTADGGPASHKREREYDAERPYNVAGTNLNDRPSRNQLGGGASNMQVLPSIPPIPPTTPSFIFVSLSSRDVLKIGNLSSLGDSEDVIKAGLKRAWLGRYHNEHTKERGLLWCLKLGGGDVWNATGTLFGIKVRRYICKLFRLFAREGLQYLTTTGINPLKTPRMVFTSGHTPDPDADYFMISFSSDQRTLHIIDAPQNLAETIGLAVGIHGRPFPLRRDKTPRVNEWITRQIYEVPTYPDFNKDMTVLMTVLRLMAAEGWRLEASVFLGRCGILGLKGRPELWMMRKTFIP